MIHEERKEQACRKQKCRKWAVALRDAEGKKRTVKQEKKKHHPANTGS